MNWAFFLLQQRQNLERRFGANIMHLSLPSLVVKAVVPYSLVLWLLIRFYCCSFYCSLWLYYFCSTLLYVYSSFKLSWWGGVRLLCLVCIAGVSRLLFDSSSSRRHWFVCFVSLFYCCLKSKVKSYGHGGTVT